MSSNVDLKTYLPTIYDGVVEMEALQDGLSCEINNLYDVCMLAMADQFIQTCSETGIVYYESCFSILAQPSIETLAFRRLRILNRLRSKLPPYTRRYLAIMLDKLIGENRYSMYVNWEQRTLNLEYVVKNISWYKEVDFLITNIKPCNLVFIHIPLVYHNIYVAEQINNIRAKFNYKLDGTWLVGEKTIAQCTNNLKLGTWKLGNGLPISTLGIEEVLKMTSTHSIQDNILQQLAEDVLQDIDHILLSDGTNIHPITSISKTRTGATVNIQYALTSCELSYISNIKVCKKDGTLVADSNVYIKIDADLVLKHNIPITEGVYNEL